MKKWLVGIGGLFVVMFVIVGIIYYTQNGWEITWESREYRYAEEIEETGDSSEETVFSGDFAYDNSRYYKVKLVIDESIVEPKGTAQILDAQGNILKEWDMSGQAVWEGEIEKAIADKMACIKITMKNEKCEGSCGFALYGKKKIIPWIRDLMYR